MYSTTLISSTDNRITPTTLRRTFGVFLVVLCGLSAPAAQEMETVTEIPVPVTILTATERVRITSDARINASMELLALNPRPLLERLAEHVDPDIADTLRFLAESRWLRPDDFTNLDINFRFDPEQLAVELEIPVTALETRVIPIYQPPRLPAWPEAENARIALGVPLWIQHRGIHPADRDSLNTITLRAAPGLHISQWVLESDLILDWSDDDPETNPELSAENTRLLRTWDDSGLRLQAGQFVQFTRGLQLPRRLLGASLDNLQADSRRAVVPVLFDRPFVIDEPGTLDVYLNERRMRSIPVQPGRYDLTELPILPGINTVRVDYVRDSGLVEQFDLVLPHSGGLLNRGAFSYALALGVDEEDLQAPVGSGFFRYGLAETLTAGVATDATETGVLTGLDLVAATPVGEPSVGVYGTVDEQQSVGWALQGGYRYGHTGRPWLPAVSTTVEYRDPGFVRPGAPAGAASQAWQLSTALAQRLPGRIGLSLGHVYRSYHEDLEDSSFFYGTLSRGLGPRFNLRVSGSMDVSDPEERWGMTITLTTQATRANVSGSATTDVRTGTMDLGGTAAHTGSTTFSTGLRARGIALDSGTVDGFSGTVRAAGTRFDLTSNASLELEPGETPMDQGFRSGAYSVQLGSGVYAAGGMVGLGAPMRSAFTLVGADRNLPARTVAVRSPGRATARESGVLGPAVLGPLAPGIPEPITVDVPGIPADYALGRTEYIVTPSYRSGAAIRITPTRRLYVRGRLLDETGEPLAFLGLRVVSETVDLPTETIREYPAFTDDSGVFEVYDLEPGAYTITLRDGSGRSASLIVPDAEGPLVRIDDIRVPGGGR